MAFPAALAAAGVQAGGSLLGGFLDHQYANASAKMAYDLKKKWALEGPAAIRKGATDAGFNPLVFAGAQTYNPSPVAIGTSGLPEAAAAVGRGIERHYQAKLDRENAALAQSNERERLKLERERLAEIRRAKEVDQDIARQRMLVYKADVENRARNWKAQADAGMTSSTPLPL